MAKHVMIDIETLGIGHDAVVASLAAVQFTLEDGIENVSMPRPHVYKKVMVDKQPERRIDGSTVMWWLGQSNEARYKTFFEGERCTLQIALTALQQFMNQFDPKDTVVWANGVTFDITILEHAYRQLGMNVPWQYSKVACMRTLKNITPMHLIGQVPLIGTAHDALDDARWQANYVAYALKHLRSEHA